MSGNHDDAGLGALPLAQFELEPIELLMLEVLRNFCLQFADPDSEGQGRAFECAERGLGKEPGHRLASGILNLVSAVRGERLHSFGFGDPRCVKCRAQIYPLELSFLRLICAASDTGNRDMQTLARTLIEGANIAATLRAAFELANILAGPSVSVLAAPVPENSFMAESNTLH